MTIVARDQIRPAIREMDTIEELQGLIDKCFDYTHSDADFIQECASEIYWRQKEHTEELR